jgi:hypothetical protein
MPPSPSKKIFLGHAAQAGLRYHRACINRIGTEPIEWGPPQRRSSGSRPGGSRHGWRRCCCRTRRRRLNGDAVAVAAVGWMVGPSSLPLRHFVTRHYAFDTFDLDIAGVPEVIRTRALHQCWFFFQNRVLETQANASRLTWLVLGGDPAFCSCREVCTMM